MAKNFYETIIASGGFAGEYFDVAVGPANTGVIDTLLSVGDGALTIDAPINIISSGALGSARALDITGMEQDGRFFFLSVDNSDIGVNSLTVTATTDINGGGASLVVSTTTDYIFVHQTGGTWKAFTQFQTASSGVWTQAEKDNLGLELEYEFAQKTYFKDYTFTGPRLTAVDIYETAAMLVQLFSKTLSYTGSRLDSFIITRISDGATLTKTFTYAGSRLDTETAS